MNMAWSNTLQLAEAKVMTDLIGSRLVHCEGLCGAKSGTQA
jgi:hypothetical protein